ncbi:MAG: ABC transporter substrate-binding protein [Candidatus Sumerlaeaceae bacterium]|nr:ABC transporter substrate-binding protein [Candidatus Sumerlaeaceae bacterium]
MTVQTNVFSRAFCAFGAFASLAGISQAQEKAAPKGDPIVIGIAAPMTGNSAEFGTQIGLGVALAKAEINAAGGINGRPLELKVEDDAGNPADAQTVSTRLASNPKVLAVVGHFNSSCSLAGKGAYSEAKMVMFSPASTNVTVTKDSDYAFRNIFTDDFQGQSLATYTGKVLGLKKVAILYDNDDYGTGLKESYKKKAAELKLDIVSETAYSKDNNDFRSQLETVRASNPEIILIAGLYNQAAVIAKQARELGIKTQLIGGDGVFSPAYMELGGKAAEGTFVTSPYLFDQKNERSKKFYDDFKKMHNKEPDAWAAQSYDALMLIVKAIKEKGASREAIHNYMKSVNSVASAYDGLTGKTYFDSEGDCRKPVQVAVVKDGKFVLADKQLSAE